MRCRKDKRSLRVLNKTILLRKLKQNFQECKDIKRPSSIVNVKINRLLGNKGSHLKMSVTSVFYVLTFQTSNISP
jgi:hypothetical protein